MGIDVFNTEDSFFNDSCYTSDDRKDVRLSDRVDIQRMILIQN